jgi:hypothetical protein
VLLLAAAAVSITAGLRRTPPPAAPLPQATFSIAPPVAAGIAPGAQPPSDYQPNHVYIPSIGVAAAFSPISPDHGTLEPPYWPGDVGINATGGQIDADAGTVLLASHVNYVGRGNGAFADLYKLAPLADVWVSNAANTLTHWVIVQVTDPLKSSGIDQTIFSADGPRRIVLATCGGAVHHGQYDRNVLAYGVPAPA